MTEHLIGFGYGAAITSYIYAAMVLVRWWFESRRKPKSNIERFKERMSR
jgi:hypothetical protein